QERRSADTLERIGSEITKMAGAVDRRLDESERRLARLARAAAPGDADVAIEARLREIETQSANAVARVGEEMARVAERMEDQLRGVEQRSGEAIESVSSEVKRLLQRVEEGGPVDPNLSRRILEESEERTRAMVEEAMATVHRRLDDAYDQASAPNSPVQRALANLSDRLEQIEKQPHAAPYEGAGETDYSLEPPPYDAGDFGELPDEALGTDEAIALSQPDDGLGPPPLPDLDGSADEKPEFEELPAPDAAANGRTAEEDDQFVYSLETDDSFELDDDGRVVRANGETDDDTALEDELKESLLDEPSSFDVEAKSDKDLDREFDEDFDRDLDNDFDRGA
ncbi:MAG: hypothetical protein MI723_06025, partial [Caulobacterales bacterium]|nr:hypothetical protein [Caulobacterales bacterium]